MRDRGYANVFQTYHPAVAFAFLACSLVLSMACMHPVYVALSLAGALACSCVCRGGRATLLSLRWVVPLCLVVAVANPIFVSSGSTELLHIGLRAIYAEALFYGLCSGAMFASVFLWFASYSWCMDSENTLALFGNVLPVVSLMVSQVLRLVPQFVSRGKAVLESSRATSAVVAAGRKGEAAERMRVVNVLMGWGMEDSLERSDAMRARGYESGMRRTVYRRLRFGVADGVVLAIIVVLAVTSGALAYFACSRFAFYPKMSVLVLWWGFAPYALLMLVPPALHFREWLVWRRV